VASVATFCPRVVGGQLYFLDSNSQLLRTNTPLPTAASGTTGMTSYNGLGAEFLLLDRSSTVAGVDTLYIAGNSGIQKFSFDGTNWTARGSVAGTFNGMSGRVSGSNATLFVTTGDATTANNNLQFMTDTSAFNSNISGSLTTIASAGANNVFVGVAMPVPEPSGVLLGCAAVAGFRFVRRRRGPRVR
jgi:hypothetical protein